MPPKSLCQESFLQKLKPYCCFVKRCFCELLFQLCISSRGKTKMSRVTSFKCLWSPERWATPKRGNNLNLVFLNQLSRGLVMLAYLGLELKTAKPFFTLNLKCKLVNKTSQGLIPTFHMTNGISCAQHYTSLKGHFASVFTVALHIKCANIL